MFNFNVRQCLSRDQSWTFATWRVECCLLLWCPCCTWRPWKLFHIRPPAKRHHRVVIQMSGKSRKMARKKWNTDYGKLFRVKMWVIRNASHVHRHSSKHAHAQMVPIENNNRKPSTSWLMVRQPVLSLPSLLWSPFSYSVKFQSIQTGYNYSSWWARFSRKRKKKKQNKTPTGKELFLKKKKNRRYPNAGVSVSLRHSNGCISFDVGRLRFTQWRQVLDIVVNI